MNFNGNELLRILQTLPDDQKNFPIIFEDVENPNVSYSIDEIEVVHQGFIVLKSRS